MTLSVRARVASRCRRERKIHRGIKHVARAMTLNLPQTLYDLNHRRVYHSSSSPAPFRFPLPSPFPNPRTSISRFSRNVPHLPWHSTPSRRRPGSRRRRHRPRSPSSPPSSFSTFLDTLFSRRSTILSRFTAYRRPSLVLFLALDRLALPLFLLSPSNPLFPLLPSAFLTRGVAIPKLSILIYTRSRTGYDLYVAVRRIARRFRDASIFLNTSPCNVYPRRFPDAPRARWCATRPRFARPMKFRGVWRIVSINPRRAGMGRADGARLARCAPRPPSGHRTKLRTNERTNVPASLL